MAIDIVKQVSVDGGVTFLHASTPPGPVLVSPTNPVFRYVVTNTGPGLLTNVTVVDSVLGIIMQGVTLQPGAETEAQMTGTFAVGDHCNTATATGQSNGQILTATDSACYFGAQAPSIDLVKRVSVDGGITFVDANTPPGPVLVGPTNPVFRFIVTNTGDAPLTLVSINDSDLGGVLLGGNLAIGASTVVTLEGAFALGEHCNTATATGQAGAVTVSDLDTACYFGAQAPSIGVVKLVSVDGGLTFVEANVPPGPTLIGPTNPVFRYVVTNNGDVPLSLVSVTDSDLGSIILGGTLAPGQSTSTERAGTFAIGEHCNTATATGSFDGQTVTDQDIACYTGVAAVGITVRKLVSVNGGLTFVDANTPPGPFLVSPTIPQFRFVVTNSGAATLTGVTLTDSSLGPIALPTTTLVSGQSVSVTLPGTFAQGQHCNLATATGTAGAVTVTDTDSACFRGIISAIPVFPDISGPAPQPQIIDRLLETIALEELALAALINAEAEKVQAVAAAGIVGPVDAEELTRINLAVAEVIRMAGVKEEHLRRKLLRILAHKERGTSPGAGG